MSKQSKRVLKELSSATEEELILKATIHRQTLKRLQKEAEDVEPVNKKRKSISTKQKYHECLTNNGMVDNASQKESVKLPSYDNVNIRRIANKFKSVGNSSKLSVLVNSCENFKPTTNMEKIVSRIYLFVLRLHLEKPWYFSAENLKRYSELDFQIKFWSHLFETYLGRNRHVVLQWGDTMSQTCKKAGLRFKLDLRLLVLRHHENYSRRGHWRSGQEGDREETLPRQGEMCSNGKMPVQCIR